MFGIKTAFKRSMKNDNAIYKAPHAKKSDPINPDSRYTEEELEKQYEERKTLSKIQKL